jgi:hypothetical protein
VAPFATAEGERLIAHEKGLPLPRCSLQIVENQEGPAFAVSVAREEQRVALLTAKLAMSHSLL